MRVAIAGAGAVGRSIARELLENGHEVLLIDQKPSSIKVDSVPRAEWLLAEADLNTTAAWTVPAEEHAHGGYGHDVNRHDAHIQAFTLTFAS